MPEFRRAKEKARADMHNEPGLFPAFARKRQIAILAADS
jgi:hypothetical protein